MWCRSIHHTGIDFLASQPQLPSKPDIFLLRYILHDHSDKYASILLKHLRAAAEAHTKLTIIDFVVDYTCSIPEGSDFVIPGGSTSTAPQPLLPNYGVAGAYPYNMDMMVCRIVRIMDALVLTHIRCTDARLLQLEGKDHQRVAHSIGCFWMEAENG